MQLSEQSAKKNVMTMVSHSDTATAVTCLKSVLHYSVEPIQFVIFDDGTLDSADKDQLKSVSPGTTIVEKAEADELCLRKLSGYPTCVRFRSANVLFRKLFDIPLATSADLFYIDSDIYFFKPFAGLFALDEREQDVVFMDNRVESYSVRPWHIIGSNGLNLASRINTGIICLRRGCLDLDFIEHVLRRWGSVLESHHLWWGEQTCWAALATRLRAYVCDRKQIAIMRSGLELSEEMCAVHFVSSFRHALPYYSARYPAVGPISPALQVSAHRVRPCTALSVTKSLLRLRAGRIRSRVLPRRPDSSNLQTETIRSHC